MSLFKLKQANSLAKVEGRFTLGAPSNGIDPLTEDVTLEVGTFTQTIPAGSFEPGKGVFEVAGFLVQRDSQTQSFQVAGNIGDTPAGAPDRNILYIKLFKPPVRVVNNFVGELYGMLIYDYTEMEVSFTAVTVFMPLHCALSIPATFRY